MCITETELIKELLSRYSTKAGKSWLQQQGSKHFIGRGLLMANGNDWYHQRHIVAPAFMGDKLKVHMKINHYYPYRLKSRVRIIIKWGRKFKLYILLERNGVKVNYMGLGNNKV